MDLNYKTSGYPEIIGGSLNLSIEDARTRVMAYGGKHQIETSFVEASAHEILKKDWDTSKEGSWDADKIQDDNTFADVWNRYKIDADDSTYASIDQSANGSAEKAFRRFSKNIAENNDDDGGKKEGMVWVKDTTWKTGQADDVNVGFRFDNSQRPFVKFSGVYNTINTKVKDLAKTLTCSIESHVRIFKHITDETIPALLPKVYYPFTTRVRDRYIKESAVNSQRTKPDGTATNKDERDDTDDLNKWATNQKERVAQQSISGNLTLAGIRMDIKAGQTIDNIIVQGQGSIAINATIISVVYSLESQTTDIQVGRV